VRLPGGLLRDGTAASGSCWHHAWARDTGTLSTGATRRQHGARAHSIASQWVQTPRHGDQRQRVQRKAVL
jgi:hypothetical protein